MNQKQTLDISWQSFIRFFVILGGILLVIYLKQLILALIMAFVCAALFEKPIRFLEKIHIRRFFGTLLVYFIAFVSFAFLFYLLMPSIWQNLNYLYNLLPLENLNLEWLSELFFTNGTFHFPSNLNDFFSRWGEINTVFSGLFQLFNKTFGGLLYTLLIIFLSFYINADRNGIESLIRFFSPKGYEGYILNFWHRFEHLMGRWFYSQLASSFILAIVILGGLIILKVPSALLLSFIALVLNFIPYVGALLALALALILASEKGFLTVLLVILLYFIAQQIEQVVSPFIRGKILKLSPLAIILAVIIGGILGGILGVLLALPLLIFVMEIIKDIKSGKFDSLKPQQKLI